MNSLTTIAWESIYNELNQRAPLLFSTLHAVLGITSRADEPRQKAAMCTSVGILLFVRNHYMSLIQRLASLILYSGHCSKNVTVVMLPKFVHIYVTMQMQIN